MAQSLDLTQLLPIQLRDKTIDSLLRGSFNRHLSKSGTSPIYGELGSSTLSPGEVRIKEADLDRQINQITPLIYAKHATEELVFSWSDLQNKLALLGVDKSTLGDWFKSRSYNFVPPIDLDKFCNYQEYFWIGAWIQDWVSNTSISPPPFHLLGIPSIEVVASAFAASNSSYAPEYYTIGRGDLDVNHHPLALPPNSGTWSDWSLTNLWVHKDDIIAFLSQYGGFVGFSTIVQAIRPIIEYDKGVRLNYYQDALGSPAESGTYVPQVKIRDNQPPLFDLYSHDGVHTGLASSIFYYQEGSKFPVDAAINRRVASDANGYIFEHVLFQSGELLFYKKYEAGVSALRTIWLAGEVDLGPRYVKYDTSGTLINTDKFNNYRNYYWVATDLSNQPSYNVNGLPEYSVIEPGGTSDWSIYNSWVHVQQLKKADLSKYVQAVEPIIEFNVSLEPSLLGPKTKLGQLPRFDMFQLDQSSGNYLSIFTQRSDPGFDSSLDDGYLGGALFAKIDDLGPHVREIILANPDVLALTVSVTVSGVETHYLQGLNTLEYLNQSGGEVYGYRGSIWTTTSCPISDIKTTDTCIPEIVTFTYNGNGEFLVEGTVTGTNPTAYLASMAFTPYTTTSGATLTISGSSSLDLGDTIVLELKGFVTRAANLYVNIGSSTTYRTLSSPSDITSELLLSNKIILGNTSLGDGVWEVPPQLKWNVANETRAIIGQGDLYFHLISIIESQVGFVGSRTGSNNWRQLTTVDFGAGGLIKQFDENAALLISLLLQDGVTVQSLLDFGRQSYETLFNEIKIFVSDVVPQLINDGALNISPDGVVDSSMIQAFKSEFYKSQSGYFRKLGSESSVSNHSIFYDTTSPISGLVATLPYMGLVDPVQPRIELDLELNFNVLVHHDGHRTALSSGSTDLLKKIVSKQFIRSPGQESAGIVSGFNFPERPYKKQFWYKTSTSQLLYYNVISDTGELPAIATNGDFSYDRTANVLYQFNGSWNLLGASIVELSAPWTVINLDAFIDSLTLALEQELYDGCAPASLRSPRFSIDTSSPQSSAFLQEELEKFGVIYGATDVYGSTFSQSNPFTWNYSSLGVPAAWQQVYLSVYGTPRPDLQPWIPAGYASESLMLNDLIINLLIPTQTPVWLPSMWAACANFLRPRFPGNKLSVDASTGALIPPYFTSSDALFSIAPQSAPDNFPFGTVGPVELYWRKTLNFLYSEQKVYFKLNPLRYVSGAWGVKYELVGNYLLNLQLGRKESPSDLQLHGDQLTSITSAASLSVSLTGQVPYDQVYTLTCVSRIDEIFRIQSPDGSSFIKGTNGQYSFSDQYVTFNLVAPSANFYLGDKFTVTVYVSGTYTESFSPATTLLTEGLSQLYVQNLRQLGEDESVSLNRTLMKDWTVKLGYRFGGLVDTDSLSVKVQSTVVDTNTFSILLKENKYNTSAWIDALRVQLVQRGSSRTVNGVSVPAQGSGDPGDDWIFRVDNYNPARTLISWYVFDESSTAGTFIALNGSKTSHEWKKYSTVLSTMSYHAPFLIKGIQNVVNFITGYAAYLEAQGWRLNDQDRPVIDSTTGRQLSYQLLVEKFIVQQFSGVIAGSTFLFNPFETRIWFATPTGRVADLFETISTEQETVCTLLDHHGIPLKKRDVKVFRQDQVTEINFDVPAFTVHLLTSMYEHVILFDNYTLNDLLIYDAFLGQVADSIFLNGKKQSVFTGKLDMGGYYFTNGMMRVNVENSVTGILDLYSSHNPVETPAIKRARALLGFDRKSYFSDRGASYATEFKFWQGMIGNKGTNFAIDAYVNAAQYQTYNLDEYWAYKLATYGDANPITVADLRVEPTDCTTDNSKYVFLEADEAMVSSDLTGGFDTTDLDVTAYDVFTLYTSEQSPFIDQLDPRGCIIIKSSDESRWFTFDDLGTVDYLVAEVISEQNFVPSSLGSIYTVVDQAGVPVRADHFELFDVNYVPDAEGFDNYPIDTSAYDRSTPDRYREGGDYMVGADTVSYGSPSFVQINHSTIKLLDPNLIGKQLKIVGYGPAISQYSPSLLFNYRANALVNNSIIWWDPARGSHHPEAISNVDFEQDIDPAMYNQGLGNFKNSSINPLSTWGADQVGQVWWNTKNLAYRPYSDAKIINDVNDRLGGWGGISDASTIDIFQWTESSVLPKDYKGDGEVAINDLLTRNRTWYQRPVAWKYSATPGLTDRVFAAYAPDKLYLVGVKHGVGVAVLESKKFESVGITKGSKFSSATFSTSTPSSTPTPLRIAPTPQPSPTPSVAMVAVVNSASKTIKVFLGATQGSGGVMINPGTSTTSTTTTLPVSSALTPGSIKITWVAVSRTSWADMEATDNGSGIFVVTKSNPASKGINDGGLGLHVGTIDYSTGIITFFPNVMLNITSTVSIPDVNGNYGGPQGQTKDVVTPTLYVAIDNMNTTPVSTVNGSYYNYWNEPIGSSPDGFRYTVSYQKSDMVPAGLGSTTTTVTPGRVNDPFNLVDTSVPHLDANLTSISGMAQVTSSSRVVIGSSTDPTGGAYFPRSGGQLSLSVSVDPNVLSYRQTYLGKYIFGYETSVDINGFTHYFIRLSCLASRENQIPEMVDGSFTLNTTDRYEFDSLGITIYYRQLSNVLTVAGMYSAFQIATNGCELYLRSAVDIFVPITFPSSILTNDTEASGWIAWNDPPTNPINGPTPPYHNYSPFLGGWSLVGDFLTSLNHDITTRAKDPWVGFDGSNYNSYKEVWSPWVKIEFFELTGQRSLLNYQEFLKQSFFIDGVAPLELIKRVQVFVNETEINKASWTASVLGSGSYINIYESEVKLGDFIRVRVHPTALSKSELSFDPTVADNVLMFTQYTRDTPYVVETVRNDVDQPVITSYYFWVKNRVTLGTKKTLAVSTVANLLRGDNVIYAIPQIFKEYNQLDARPNRYAMLAVNKLGTTVTEDSTYKLRISQNSTLRNHP